MLSLIAIDLCNALTDMTDAEKEAELLPITVQQVYILTQLGRIDEADQLVTTISFSKFVTLKPHLNLNANKTKHQRALNSLSRSSKQHRCI